MAKAKKQTYYINARIVVETSIPIEANSLDEALAESKILKLDDFMDLTGDNIDNDLRITGVHAYYKGLEA